MLILPFSKAKLNVKVLITFLLVGTGILINNGASARGSSIPREKTNSQPIIKDYGTHRQVFNIAEECLLEEIMSRLELAKENGTLDLLQNEFIEKVKARVLRPSPVPNLTKATINRSWTYNPTFTQETDIVDDKGRVIVAAGTSINALEKLKWGSH